MSDLYPNLGRDGQILDMAAAADVMVDDGVGPEAVRISVHAQPDTTGVADTNDINTEFVPHSRKAPPAPKQKKKKNKGGRKKSKVSRRRTKRKKTRKQKKTRKRRGGMYPSKIVWVRSGDNFYFPPQGYTELKKDAEYERISNAVMSSIMNEHFLDLLDIMSTFKKKHVYFTDLSNIGGEIKQKERRTPSPHSDRPMSVEPGPTGYNLVERIIRPEVLSNSINPENVFVNVSKTDITPDQQRNAQYKTSFSSVITLDVDNIPGMPGGAKLTYNYEIIVYTFTPQVKTICVKINETIGMHDATVTHHGVDDLLLWVLFKIAVSYTDTIGATIITNDNMRFILSGSDADKEFYRHFDSKIRKKVELDSKFNLVIPS